jgi:hypothetical protein
MGSPFDVSRFDQCRLALSKRVNVSGFQDSASMGIGTYGIKRILPMLKI